MDVIELKWKGPFKYSKLEDCEPQIYKVYLHSIVTKVERIWYVGRTESKRQKDHSKNNYLKPSESTIDLIRIKNDDIYLYCANDAFKSSVNDMIIIEPSNSRAWEEKIGSDESMRRRKHFLDSMNVYYAEINDKEIDTIKKIECNIQYFLIKKYRLDVYRNGNYKIGFTPVGGQNQIDTRLVIINNLNDPFLTDKNIFYEHFDNCRKCDYGIIDLSNEKDIDQEKIKGKLLDKNWNETLKG